MRVELARIEHELAAAVTAEAATGEQLRALLRPGGRPDARAAGRGAGPGRGGDRRRPAGRGAAAGRRRAGRGASQGRDALAGLQDAAPDGVEAPRWPRRSSGTCSPAWPPSGRCRSAARCPWLLDDALLGLDEDEVNHVLGRLERMAEAVQVIVLSDDPLASSWAHLAGDERAARRAPAPT